MEPKEILKIAKEIRNSSHPNKKLSFTAKYKSFTQQYPLLFDMCCDDSSDFSHLEFMIEMMQKVQDNKKSAEVANVDVGQKMFDHFVKPLVDMEKEQKGKKENTTGIEVVHHEHKS